MALVFGMLMEKKTGRKAIVSAEHGVLLKTMVTTFLVS